MSIASKLFSGSASNGIGNLKIALEACTSPGDEAPQTSDRLFLVVDEDDAKALEERGLPADVFSTPRSMVNLDVFVVAPTKHLYASEQAQKTAAAAWAAGARSIKIVSPLLGQNQTVRQWLDVVRADEDPEAVDELEAEAENAREWTQAQPGPVGARPEIEITTEELIVNDQVIAALARDPGIYRCGDVLATIADVGASPRGVNYQDGPPPQIRPLGTATLRERITSRVRLLKAKEKKDVVELTPAHPPDWCVKGVHERGEYPGVRPIEGVIQAPTMRRDGSILDQTGYDPATRLYYKPNALFEAIPRSPTRLEAETARNVLLDVVIDFPFKAEKHRAVWLASFLTVIGRSAFEGPAPLFGFDGNTPGTGKSKLADAIALAATGRKMPRTIWPGGKNGDEEMRKRITSLALAGERFVLLDNIDEPLGGAPLDAALTADTWKDRILGVSSMTKEMPLNVVWFASGNNLQCRGDILRRVLFVRLESPLENPEERQGFRHPNLLKHVADSRAKLVCAALTILRAYQVAGRPEPLPALGSFEEWTRVIAEPVAWITGVNPIDVQKDHKANDQAAALRNALVAGWAELPNAEGGVTVAEAVRHLKSAPDQLGSLRGALMELSSNSDLPSPKSIGRHLTTIKGRVVDIRENDADRPVLRMLDGNPNRKDITSWRVVDPSKTAGFAGFETTMPGLDESQTRHTNTVSPNDLDATAGFAGFESDLSYVRKTTPPVNSYPDGPETNPANPANPAPDPRFAVFIDGDRPF